VIKQSACLGSAIFVSFTTLAGIAQLVERNLAKVDVAGSSPVSRSVPHPTRERDIRQSFVRHYDCRDHFLYELAPLPLYSHQATGFFM
jgi:hypothetical protein